MAVVQLASQEDVEAAFGRDLTPEEEERVGAILDKASELFRLASGQQFTPGRSTSRIKVNGGRAFLRQKPVTVIHTVTDDRGDDVPFELSPRWLTVPRISHEFVNVDYSHGGDVPDLVRLTIADVTRQVLSINPNAAEGVTQYSATTGPFTDQYTYATWAQGGATRLAPDDLAVAHSFRLRVPNVWVPS
ncbi:hypothetical protein ILP86_04685 [Microbacterium sp. R1]|uniref:Head-to-tail adaptor n=1 Tax=Microbacterium phage vB_MoxS-R1 TaxID=2848881 RepID=A0A8F2E511_9CAUD|nr:hypothetical protein [Microbacterium sp. R1]YP_010649930.1 head-tail adaptor Ad1 [Microbacterium phage vB_MoxS-R1]MBE7953615.1 hypothetical protein [Microbacterium sp. R1]QWT28900.1 hypothetical protein vBMoxSR1_gp50 [Microbacterium phage vB_MoxS-R1]